MRRTILGKNCDWALAACITNVLAHEQTRMRSQVSLPRGVLLDALVRRGSSDPYGRSGHRVP